MEKKLHHMYSPIVATLQQYCDGTGVPTDTRRRRRRCNTTLVATSGRPSWHTLAAQLSTMRPPDIFVGIGMTSALERVPWTWLAANHVMRIRCEFAGYLVGLPPSG